MGKILGEYGNVVINVTLKIHVRIFNHTLVMLIENDHSFSIKEKLKERKFEFSISRRRVCVIPKCLLISDDSQLMADRYVIGRLSAFLILALLF